MSDKAIKEWIDHHLPNKETSDLWDLQAAVLTELSQRDSVQYRVRAEPTVAARMAGLDRALRSGLDSVIDDEDTHDSEGC